MGVFDTSVNDIDASTLAGGRVIVVRGAAALTVRDASQAPGSASLLGDGVDADDGILLNELDLQQPVSDLFSRMCVRQHGATYIRVTAEALKLLLVEGGGETLHDFRVDMIGVGHLGRGLHDANRRAVLELDNVLASNGLRAAGLEERSGLNDGGRQGQRKNCNDGQTHLGKKEERV